MNSIQHIIKAIRGDRSSIRWLYDMNIDTVYSSSIRITNDHHATEDILQESFVHSITKLNTLSDSSKYQGWLRRIVINRSLNYIKKNQSFSEIEEYHLSETLDNRWYDDIPMTEIKDAIQLLPTRCRAVFCLYAIEDYKHNEIAVQLEISTSTSKSQYQYAKKLLKESFIKKYAR